MRRAPLVPTPLALLLVALAAACASGGRQPDLSGLYNRSARFHGPERNPIVVIPGLTGSKLVDRDSGRVVWGAFSGDYARPGKPDGARLFALPMRHGVPLAELADAVSSDGVLDRLEIRVLGLPLQMRAYLDILATLGVGGYRDEDLARSGAVDYGDGHFTCFQFAYDWRRDNVENARRLHEFLLEKRAYVRREVLRRYGIDKPDIKFDVVAHSMGALLLRYYLRYGAAELAPAAATVGPATDGEPPDDEHPAVTWAGTDLVESAVLVAPPNGGSLAALHQLVDGRELGPLLPRYPAAVLGTFPAGYQLLPRSRHRPAIFADAPDEPLDLYDAELWEELGWGLASPAEETVLAWLLPDEPDAAQRREIALDHQRKSLARARQFAEAIDRPAEPPPGLRLFLIAGDAVETDRRVAVDRRTGRLEVVARGPGDSTVLRSSALLDERTDADWQPRLVSPIAWDDVLFLFERHLGLTKSPAFTDNVLYWLLESPR